MNDYPANATEPMQRAMQRSVLMRKSMNDVWRAALAEAPESQAHKLLRGLLASWDDESEVSVHERVQQVRDFMTPNVAIKRLP